MTNPDPAHPERDWSIASELTRLGFQPEPSEPWTHVGHSERRQGWKLHVSSVPTQARKLLEQLSMVLKTYRVPFKAAANASTLRQLNEGALGDTQVGKFITIYPNSDEQAADITKSIRSCTDGQGFGGPRVVTDIKLGDVLYARFGPFRPHTSRDRLGRVRQMISLPDGSLQPDDYVVPYTPPSWAGMPFELDEDIETSERSDLLGPGYLILEVLKAAAKGRTLVGLDLNSQETVRKVIVKEGRPYCLSDEYGRDIRDRLKHQYRVLRYIETQGGPSARPTYFEVDSHGFLALDYIEGFGLPEYANKIRRENSNDLKAILSVLANLSESVGRLHTVGILHRDITPRNVLVDSTGKAQLIDYELAALDGDIQPVFRLGTPGYMSPQQVNAEPASARDDIYALCALCVLVLSGADPRYVSVIDSPETRMGRLRSLGLGDGTLTEAVARGLSASSTARPSIGEISAALQDATGGRTQRMRKGAIAAPASERPRRASLLSSLGDALMESEAVSGDGIWLSHRDEDARSGAQGHRSLVAFRSAYRGVAGPLYVLSLLKSVGYLHTDLSTRVEYAIDWLLQHHPTEDDQLPGLYFGEAGVAVAVSEAVSTGLVAGGEWHTDYLLEALNGPLDWPDMTHGAAGQVVGSLAVSLSLGLKSVAAGARRCVEHLGATQSPDGSWVMPGGVDGMEGVSFTGFAHGVSGILYALSAYQTITDDRAYEEHLHRGLNWLMSESSETEDGGLRWPTRAGGSEYWNWWCHGNPGVALGLMRIYTDSGDSRVGQLAERAVKAIHIPPHGADLGQCHGISGLGEVLLEAGEVLNDRNSRRHATVLADRLHTFSDESVAQWAVLPGQLPTMDLMVGSTGVAHFLARESGLLPAAPPPMLLTRSGNVARN